jgi:hypothetical protein
MREHSQPAPELAPLWARRPVVGDWLTPAEIVERAATDPDQLGRRVLAGHGFLGALGEVHTFALTG